MVYPCFYSEWNALLFDSASPSRVGNNLLTKLFCSLYCSEKVQENCTQLSTTHDPHGLGLNKVVQ